MSSSVSEKYHHRVGYHLCRIRNPTEQEGNPYVVIFATSLNDSTVMNKRFILSTADLSGGLYTYSNRRSVPPAHLRRVWTFHGTPKVSPDPSGAGIIEIQVPFGARYTPMYMNIRTYACLTASREMSLFRIIVELDPGRPEVMRPLSSRGVVPSMLTLYPTSARPISPEEAKHHFARDGFRAPARPTPQMKREGTRETVVVQNARSLSAKNRAGGRCLVMKIK